MLSWIPYAFIRFVIVLAAGIILGIYLPDMIPFRIALGIVVILSAVYFVLIIFKSALLKFINPGTLGLPFLLLIGYSLVFIRTEANDQKHFVHFDSTIHYYKVTIVSYPEEKKNSWKEVGEITAIKTQEGWKLVRGKVLMYFDKDEFRSPFRYGDILLIKGKPQEVLLPSNPYEFDYKRFLSFRNIFHQHFIKKKDAVFVQHDPPSTINELMLDTRAWSVANIKKFVKGDRQQAIATALVVGVTDNLDEDILQAYSASGAMHVLAVSGLHIGILYSIIIVVLTPLKRFSSNQWTVTLASLILLWGYAFITGLSPSVLRAVTMFSFVALAKPLQKNSDIYNTLALSAFCLLLYDPYLIMSVGFQLSYLAVLGIVYLYPRFILMWAPSSWLMTQVWKITCVSLAAQIATFPLTLLYFHQFPVYFWVANLFVIPLSFAVLVLGLFLITVSFISPFAELVGTVLTYVIKLLNAGVVLTEKIPGSVITQVHLSTLQCWLLMFLIMSFILIFQLRKFWLLYVSLALAAGFTVVHWVHFREIQNTSKLVVYNVRGHSVIDILNRGNAIHFADSLLLTNPQQIAYQLDNNRTANLVQSVYSADSLSIIRNLHGCRLIQWNNVTLLQIVHKDFSFTDDFPVDYVIIANNAVRSFKSIQRKVNGVKIIIDSSNSRGVAEKLMQESKQISQPVHSVLHSGAFIAKL